MPRGQRHAWVEVGVAACDRAGVWNDAATASIALFLSLVNKTEAERTDTTPGIGRARRPGVGPASRLQVLGWRMDDDKAWEKGDK